MRRIIITILATVILFAAGVAAAGVDLKKVILKPGQCIKVAKVTVCAAKVRPPVTTTVTTPPVTVTTPAPPPVTVTAPPVTVTITTTPTPKVAFSDGTYRVGPDIQSGTYRAIAPSSFCYWERLSGFGGSLNEIIENAINQSIVTIAPTDVGFRSDGCGNWTMIG